MNAEALSDELLGRSIRPTALRILILRTMKEMDCAASLSDLEERLVTVDKSTIFRTLTLFLAHHIVHAVDDGTGAMKYAVCRPGCRCGEEGEDDLGDLHTHFYCEGCHHTFCLRGLPVPVVTLPEGFRLHTANYVLKGLCPACAARAAARTPEAR